MSEKDLNDCEIKESLMFHKIQRLCLCRTTFNLLKYLSKHAEFIDNVLPSASYKYSIPNDWGLTTKKVCAKIKSHAETDVGSARFWYNKL